LTSFKRWSFFVFLACVPTAGFALTPICLHYTGWTGQTNPPTDTTGLANTNFPEASSTSYWGSTLSAPVGTTVTVHGQYPLARFMALELYTGDTLVDFINDSNIQPDTGQNNPYVTGTANGTYTAYIVFGTAPSWDGAESPGHEYHLYRYFNHRPVLIPHLSRNQPE
jgi:hypothetical protein